MPNLTVPLGACKQSCARGRAGGLAGGDIDAANLRRDPRGSLAERARSPPLCLRLVSLSLSLTHTLSLSVSLSSLSLSVCLSVFTLSLSHPLSSVVSAGPGGVAAAKETGAKRRRARLKFLRLARLARGTLASDSWPVRSITEHSSSQMRRLRPSLGPRQIHSAGHRLQCRSRSRSPRTLGSARRRQRAA